MALQIKQVQKLSQMLVMTPQLQQAIKLLQLSRLELLDTIHEELEINPILEEAAPDNLETEMDRSPDEEAKSEAQTEYERDNTSQVEVNEKTRDDDIDWDAYFQEYNTPFQAATPTEREEREEFSFESVVSAQPGLMEHLQWQLTVLDLSDEDKFIAIMLLGNIKPDGYLDADLETVAQSCGTTSEEVERVLMIIQTMDPPGVGARDLRECLLIQASQEGWEGTLAWEIIDRGLDLLGNKNYKALAKLLGATSQEVYEAAQQIVALDPKPGRNFSSEPPQYISPDISIIKVDGEYQIVLNEDGLPKLKINSFYRQAMTDPALVTDKAAKEFIKDKLSSAVWLIRSIHQRQRTIYRVTESIAKRQRSFLDDGITNLKPMVLRDVAEDVGMHESTISRVTTNKYVHTPQGIFELKFFFNSAIKRFHGEDLASESVKERIKQIIDSENQTKPLSDDRIRKILAAENIDIARRTVAKYREVMGILPSSKRKAPILGKG